MRQEFSPKYFLTVIICVLLTAPSAGFAVSVSDEAQRIYEKNAQSVFQVMVIDNSTGKKSSIGSGFLFSREGHIATNFHVVSQIVESPERYRLEYLKDEKSSEPMAATIETFDVVHDLAILRTEARGDSFIPLGDADLSKGTKIFSMGNPHDLGMTIIDGTYNGLKEQSLYKKILFSGSLNPGMSGGPALNHKNEVIGINVSTAGNDVSFLVPVEFLKALYGQLQEKGPWPVAFWDDKIEQQLVENQEQYIQEILGKDWDTLNVGKVNVPGEVSGAFRCWGGSKDEKKDLFKISWAQCSSEDVIYISSDLYTGQIGLQYEWIQSKGLDPFRFYNLYESHFTAAETFSNAGKQDATNFQCHTDFVSINNADWKVAFCARNYKKYPLLYDVNATMAAVEENDAGLVIRLIALGVERDTAMKFIRKFLEEVQWQD